MSVSRTSNIVLESSTLTHHSEVTTDMNMLNIDKWSVCINSNIQTDSEASAVEQHRRY